MVENGASPPLADPNGAALTFVAETTDAGAPAPRMPAEAKRSHDRPPWDDPIPKSATRKARTVAQGPRQTVSVDINNPDQSDHGGHAVHPLQPAHIDATSPCYQLAIFQSFPISVDHQVSPLTDPAPASAVVCDITRDMPHRKAVNTSTWATHRHAKLGDAFPIDSGTMPPFSR